MMPLEMREVLERLVVLKNEIKDTKEFFYSGLERVRTLASGSATIISISEGLTIQVDKIRTLFVHLRKIVEEMENLKVPDHCQEALKSRILWARDGELAIRYRLGPRERTRDSDYGLHEEEELLGCYDMMKPTIERLVALVQGKAAVQNS